MLVALRTKGETVEEIEGLARTMRRFATPGRHRPRRPRRHRGHGRRAADVQRLHDRRADRRRRRLRGRQARQPLRHRAVGLRRPARGARRADRPQARRGRAVHPRGRLRLHVRPRPPRRHALRGPGAQGAGGAHDLQLPRPADQPGGRHAAGDRRLGPRVPGDDRGRAGAAGGRAGAGSVQRRRSRRDEHVGRRRASSRSTAASCARYEVTPEDVGLRAQRPGATSAGGPPDANAATTRRILAGEPRPGARPRAAQRRRRDLRRRPRGDACATGVEAAAEAVDSGAAAAALDALTALTATLSPA